VISIGIRALYEKGGWMGDHALYAQTKNLLSCACKGWIFMSYTLVHIIFLIGITIDIFVYTHILFSIYVCFKF